MKQRTRRTHIRLVRAHLARRLVPGLLALWLGTATWLSPPAHALSIVTSVGVGPNPFGIGINPTTNRIYVADYDSNTVSVIDVTNNSVIGPIAVGTNPVGIGVNQVTNRIYVANTSSNNLSVLDGVTNSTIATVPVNGTAPNSVAVNATTNRVYVADYGSNRISVLDGVSNSIIATIPAGLGPFGIGINQTTN